MQRIALAASIVLCAAFGIWVLLFLPELRASPTSPGSEVRQVASQAPPPTPTPRSLVDRLSDPPVPVEWPQLRALDEKVHEAHELSLAHDHPRLYTLLPTLTDDVRVVLANPIPKLPGSDPDWMNRRVKGLENTLTRLDELIAMNGEQAPASANQPFWWKGDPTAYQGMQLHEAVNSLIDSVEVLMGATASTHHGILRAEHVHTDHVCGP